MTKVAESCSAERRGPALDHCGATNPRSLGSIRVLWSHRVLGLLVAGVLLGACGSDAAPATSSSSPSADGQAGSGAPATPAGTPPATASAAPGELGLDGSLLITEGQRIVVVAPDGQRRVVAEIDPPDIALFPAWSPDRQQVAFVRRTFFAVGPDATPDWGDDILSAPTSGGETMVLRAHAATGQQVFGLAWHPDGPLVLGRVDIELIEGRPIAVESAAIVEYDPASGSERVIVEAGYDPSLSGDGERLVYTRYDPGAGPTTAMIANGDGSNARVLADSLQTAGALRFVRISPDGTRAAISGGVPLPLSRRGDEDGWLARLLGPLQPQRAEAHGTPMDIWVTDTSGGTPVRITELSEDDPYPAWSPDGARIIFVATGGLYRVGADGSDLVRIGEGWFDGQVAIAP
jgi:dipeptidyl aminopeptidase/acylaminoacyl peptidase